VSKSLTNRKKLILMKININDVNNSLSARKFKLEESMIPTNKNIEIIRIGHRNNNILKIFNDL
jgi:hypothetical protein